MDADNLGVGRNGLSQVQNLVLREVAGIELKLRCNFGEGSHTARCASLGPYGLTAGKDRHLILVVFGFNTKGSVSSPRPFGLRGFHAEDL